VPHIDPTILPALFGLIGVIIGGAITAGVDYILEERRAHRDEIKERRKRSIDLQRAARLVLRFDESLFRLFRFLLSHVAADPFSVA
jgi:hypothetical protein